MPSNKYFFFCSLLLVGLLCCFAETTKAQNIEPKDSVENITKESLSQMTMDEFLEMPFEDLVYLADKHGVSIDELIQLVHTFHTLRTESKRSHLTTAVPVEIIQSTYIENSGQVELGQVLQYSCPSFHSTHQTIADGTDSFDPAALRGLAPDQLLVLINGKRRHTSAYVHVNGTMGRGSGGTDFNAIPISAIERIEIMRDGAAAQYGSDAIAGVINIVLKERTNVISTNVQSGLSSRGDGEQIKLSSNYGLPLRNQGFINLTAEMLHRGSINRSGNYTGPVYGDNRDQDKSSFFEQTKFDDQRVMSIGSAQADNVSMLTNVSLPLRKQNELYGFGGFNYRQTLSDGFYRFPKDEAQVVLNIYPDGFTPSLQANIIDKTMVMGIKTQRDKWLVDICNNTGYNRFDLSVKNGNNASMGVTSPTSAYAGGFTYWQNITSLEAIYSDELNNCPLNLVLGSEYRIEHYHIEDGEEASWLDGSDTTSNGTPKSIGFQYYPGFRPDNRVSRHRSNASAFADLDIEFFNRWLINTAVRYEVYSDFGKNISWKMATRFKIHKALILRGSLSTGFRAPSLPQLYYNRTSVQFIDNEALLVVNFNNESSASRAFGIQELKPEISQNLSAGLTSQLHEHLTLTIDGYLINIQDRIIMTGRFKADDNPTWETILSPMQVQQAQFFTNAINTETRGIDANITYKRNIGTGNLTLQIAAHASETKLEGDIKTSDFLAGQEDVLFNREEVSRLTSVQPSSKAIMSFSYQRGRFTVLLRNTRFGEVSYIHPEDASPENWQLNELTGDYETRDQTFRGKCITDLNLRSELSSNISFALGGNNIFNIMPDKHTHSANISHGRFVYSRRVQQFGVRGLFFYGSLNINF